MPQAHLRHQGPFLTWAAYEAVCQDFHIIIAPTSSVAGPTSPHPHPLGNPHHTHQPVRGNPLDQHQRQPSKASPRASASKAARQPDDSPTRAFSAETPINGLLSRVQACIAFVCACTRRSSVASFPNDGKSDGVVSGENARREKMSRGGSAEEKETTSCTEEDAAYWRVSFIFQISQRLKNGNCKKLT